MMHVKTIQKLVDQGDWDNAQDALETLLTLGPSNIEALKLKAYLYEARGRFDEEERVWIQIFNIDREDADAINFIFRKQLEDRERYYFTDDLPEGGRRYLAYPKSLVKISMLGLMGCITFLMLTRFAEQYEFLRDPTNLFFCFLFMVVSPWVAIIYTYLRSIRTISVSQRGIEVATRLKSFFFAWGTLEKISLSHGNDLERPVLRLVLMPKDSSLRPVEIDMTENTSAIRARSHLINEITGFFGPISYEAYGQIQDKINNPLRF